MILKAGFSPKKPLIHVGQRDTGSGADRGTEAALNAFSDEAGFRLSIRIKNFQNFLGANPDTGPAGGAEPAINDFFFQVCKSSGHGQPP